MTYHYFSSMQVVWVLVVFIVMTVQKQI